jgi:hypothetical protein
MHANPAIPLRGPLRGQPLSLDCAEKPLLLAHVNDLSMHYCSAAQTRRNALSRVGADSGISFRITTLFRIESGGFSAESSL